MNSWNQQDALDPNSLLYYAPPQLRDSANETQAIQPVPAENQHSRSRVCRWLLVGDVASLKRPVTNDLQEGDCLIRSRPGQRLQHLLEAIEKGASVRSKKNGGSHFDVSALYSALDSERIARNLNWKEVSAKSGVSASTLTRLSQGRRPDVDSLAALTRWLRIPADHFMTPRPQTCGASSPLTQISTIIRDDPDLNPDAATALEELVKATYARLRIQKEK